MSRKGHELGYNEEKNIFVTNSNINYHALGSKNHKIMFVYFHFK